MMSKVCVQCKKKFETTDWRRRTCSAVCSKERKKERHRSPAYVKRNRIGRDARRKTAPSAEYQSLRRRRPWKCAANAKRSHAKRMGIAYSLTDEWFERHYKAGCALTGLPFSIGHGRIHPLSSTVDRINPKRGYTPANCRMIIHAVNALRGTGSDVQMYQVAQLLIDNRR